MKNVTTMAAAKVAAVATGLAMATSMLSFAPMVHAAALTSTQVQSVLGLLTAFGADSATIANVSASLTGTAVTSGSTTTSTGTGTSACTFSSNLTIGSSGMAVTCLQNALIAGGFSIPAGATGYFGTQTRTAVASWQSSRNIAPAVGYFGALSRAAWNLGGSTTTSTNTTTTTTTTTSTVAGCAAGAVFSATTGAACASTSTVAGCAAGSVFSATTGQACSGTTTTVTTGALTGSGRLTNVSSLGNVTSDIQVGDAATNVIGVSADAIGGDVAIQRVDATFTINGTVGSANLDKYVSDVSLYLDGVKLQSIDPATGDKSARVWTIRFSGLNGVIRSGHTGNLYVKVTPVSSIGYNEDYSVSGSTATVTVALAADSIRAVAADGISDTYGPTAGTQTFNVSSATAAQLTLTTASDSPVAANVAVSDTNTMDGVTLLSFNMKAKNQDVTLTSLPVQLITSDTVGDMVSTIYLYKGSTMIASRSVTATTTGGTSGIATTTFMNINQTIAKDTTVNYTVRVDLKKTGAYASGATISAATTKYGWDASDADGATVTPSANTTGNQMILISNGAGVSYVSGSYTAEIAGQNPANGTISLTFKVDALGDSDISVATSTIVHALTGATETSQIVTCSGLTAVTTGGIDYYTVTSGNSNTCTLAVKFHNTTGFVQLGITSVNGTTATNVKTVAY